MPFCTFCGKTMDFGPCPQCGHSPRTTTLQFTCDADGTTLLGLYLKTFLLSIITLGIYSFWGRNEIRRYLYSSIRSGEDRLAWHGTGKEMLIGWLKAMGFLVVFYVFYFILTLAHKTIGPIIGVLFFYLVIIAVMPWVMVSVQRYRFSRTSMRGIHFSYKGQTKELARLYYKGIGLSLVTLGFYSPWFVNDVHGYNISHTYYGDQKFEFDGNGYDLFGPYIIFIFLLFPTLYLSAFWFYAKQHRYLTDHTSWRGARFRAVLRGRSLLWLFFSNLVLIIMTLGLALPWARIRSINLICRTLTLENFEGFEGVAQRVADATATGENMSSLLELDTDVGGGLGL